MSYEMVIYVYTMGDNDNDRNRNDDDDDDYAVRYIQYVYIISFAKNVRDIGARLPKRE